MKVIKKYDQGNPITTSGSGYIPAALPSSELLKNAANKLGEWFLRGLGFVGDLISTGIAVGTGSPNVPDFMNEEILNQRKEAVGKVFGALSPLNYGVAVATGNGLNPYKGEEEIATWEPYQQALARGLELYLTPKAIKAGKAGVQRGILEVKYKMLPYQEGYKYPIGYDNKGRLYANKNFFFRLGWDLIDDAEKTGVIRVPEGDYKPAVLKKYPFLDDGFSTMQESFKFPYFGKGSVSHFKFGIEPDLIAIPDLAPNTKWVGASKWGDLLPDVTPTFESHRATPLYKGQTNKFPTSKTFRFKYNEATGLYEPIVGKVKFGISSDFPKEGWTPFEDWPTHLKNAFNKAWGKGTKPYTSPQLSIFPVEGDINTGYVVENYPGYQLKSLMSGSILEKWLSKTGTINVNLLRNYLHNATKIELSIVDKVINEKFNGLKAIDYNQLKKAVLEELITYDRVPLTGYANYGIESLGYKVRRSPIRSPKYELNTFTFESPRMPFGNTAHYPGNPLGHSRTLINTKEPNVLYVLESQSDWALLKPGFAEETNLKVRYKKLKKAELLTVKSIEKDTKTLRRGLFADGRKLTYFDKQYLKEAISDAEFYLSDLRGDIKKVEFKLFPERASLELHLKNNFDQRQLQENLRFAAENGKTQLRYPTEETAAKIEDFKKSTESEAYLALRLKLEDLLKQRAAKESKNFEELIEAIRLGKALFIETQELARSRMQMQQQINETIEELRELINSGKHKDYIPKEKTILKKYADFPELFKRLYKNQTVKFVTDANGNTWYEVDVPLNYLSSEWQYKKGGKLKSKNNETC